MSFQENPRLNGRIPQAVFQGGFAIYDSGYGRDRKLTIAIDPETGKLIFEYRILSIEAEGASEVVYEKAA